MPKREPRAGDTVRTALVALLLAVGAVLVQARAPATPVHSGTAAAGPTLGSTGMPAWPVVSTLSAVAVLLIWGAVRRTRRRRRREPEPVLESPAPRTNPRWVTLLVLLPLSLPWLLWVLVRHVALPTAGSAATDHQPSGPPPHPGHVASAVSSSLDLSAWAAAGAVALLLLLLVLVSFRRSRPAGSPGGPVGDTAPAPREAGAEAVAVSLARQAVHRAGSNRRRIINAFAAMEDALAAEGAGREVSETPDELLARVSRRHPGVADQADLLTATFQLARFSGTPVTRRHVDAATEALARLEDGLVAGSAERVR